MWCAVCVLKYYNQLQEKQGKEDKNREEGMTFNTKLGQAIYRTLFVHKHPERNEHFAQNRLLERSQAEYVSISSCSQTP